MAHLIAQAQSSVSGSMSNVFAFEPRLWIASDEDGGGLAGGVAIEGSTFNPSATQLKLTQMAFGTNKTITNLLLAQTQRWNNTDCLMLFQNLVMKRLSVLN